MKTYQKNQRKAFLCLLALLAIGLALFFIPCCPRGLIDVGTSLPVSDIELIYPVWTEIAAPFFDFPFYFLTLTSPKIQLLSWFLWLSILWIIFAAIYLKGPLAKKIYLFFRGMLVTVTLFALFVIYCIFSPFPQYRIKTKNPNEIFLDLHSHTIYSHDGLITPDRSLKWHLDCGFKAWALTEHNWIGAAAGVQKDMIKRSSLDAVVITAEEINFHGVHLNLLGLTQNFDTDRYQNLKELIEAVHLQKGVVIVPHYWAETKSPFSMGDLYEAGVDGFEILGDASVPLTKNMQKEIISFCRQQGLVMLSGTNWHGWRNFCTGWTGFNVDNWKLSDYDARERLIIDALSKRETQKFRVIGYTGFFSFSSDGIWEPFTGLLAYFRDINRWQRLSWFLWAVVISFLLRMSKQHKKYIAVFFWMGTCLILLVKRTYVLKIWASVATVNEILPDITCGLLIMAVVTAVLAATNFISK